MGHILKSGNIIIDKDTKFIKKLLVKNPISYSYPFYYDDNKFLIKIINVRKYKSIINGFVYEVDLNVNVKYSSFYSRYSYSKRRINSIIRRRNKSLILEELCYFNINDIYISKINYN